MEGYAMPDFVKLFGIPGDANTAMARTRIESLGIEVRERRCPPTTAEWVDFPFVREPSGSSYYGEEGIDAFITKIESLHRRPGA